MAARPKPCSPAENSLDRPSQSDRMCSITTAEARRIAFRKRLALPRRRGGTPMLRGLFVTVVVALAGSEGPPAELNDKTFASWRDRIRPRDAERCFETVHWLPTFWDGVMTAQKE